MAFPAIAAIAGVSVLSGLAQYYTAEKARKASQAQLDKIEATFNAIKPPNYDLSIEAPPQMHDELLQSPKFSDPQAAPQFNLNALTPEQFKMIGKMSPEIAGYVAEANPTLLTKTSDMETGRKAQLSALQRMQEIGKGEFDPQYQEMVQKAARAAQGEAQSRNASIMQDFARRGAGGSGLNLAAQMAASSQGMDRNAQVNQNAASESYRNRLNALMSGAQLGSQIGQEDTSFQGRNADIINAFNDRVSRSRQAYENNRTAALNNAQQYNLGVEQDVSNRNVGAANEFARGNQQRMDELTKYGANFAQSERDRADRNAQQTFQNQDAQRRYLNSLLAEKASWQAGEREKLNKLRSQEFQDKLDIARGKSGIASQRIGADISAAQDRNAMIQGLSNAATTGAMAYQNSQDARNQNYNNANMEYYKREGDWMDKDARNRYYKSYGG